MPKIAIDHAVAEPAADEREVVVVPADFGWDDVGDFAALRTILAAPGTEPVVLGPQAMVEALESTGLIVADSGRTIAVLGLADIIVVDTPDAVLVTSAERAQDVKALVEHLRARGRSDVL